MQGKVIQFPLPQASQDTTAAVDQLRERVQSGRQDGRTVIGIALVVMYGVNDYTVDATGACKSLPHVTQGMLKTLDAELEKLKP